MNYVLVSLALEFFISKKRHFNTVIIIINTTDDVIMFAIKTDGDFIHNPYNIHKKFPVNCKLSIHRDKPRICFVIMVFIACGKNAMVVKDAAEKPTISAE